MRAWLLASVLLASCGSAAPTSTAPSGADSGFIATDRDFASYRTWPHFALSGGGQYPRVIYVNALPPAGARAFPLGTLIVKELLKPLDAGGTEVDAMAKRGGGFNEGDGGADGWEWFELGLGDGGAPIIEARGDGQGGAAGEYGGSGVSCVGCHAAAIENDYVQDPALRLDPDAG